MANRLEFQPEAEETLKYLKSNNPKKYKKVGKILAYMEVNLRHRSLQTHSYNKLEGQNKEKVFESYVENKTPGAWRIFWHYGPGRGVLTILAITPHP